jgi:uncharacterized protein (DUF362 family)
MFMVNNEKITVALVACDTYVAETLTPALDRLLDHLGGLDAFVSAGEHVLIKPNLVVAKKASTATQTDPAMIYAIAQRLVAIGAHVTVADSPAFGSTKACLKKLGVDQDLLALGVEVCDLKVAVKTTVRFSNDKVGLSAMALQVDKVINLAKLKAHQQMVMTLGVKNLFGCVVGKEKPVWHYRRGKVAAHFAELLLGIADKIAPALTIVDGVMAMEGNGPTSGDRRQLGVLVASTNTIAVDTVCCKLVSRPLQSIPISHAARRLGLPGADFETLTLVGDDIAPYIVSDFAHPDMMPIRFSPTKIIRSAIKQFILSRKRKSAS